MELRQLEYFTTLSRLKNFTRTAEILGVSQPSVTKAVKALETELGVKLIDRQHRNLTLTTEGHAFEVHAERILHDVEATKQDMQRFCRTSSAKIKVCIPPMFEAYLFPDFFTRFKMEYPQIDLVLHAYNDSEAVRRLVDSGELDFGIVMGEDIRLPENEMSIARCNMNLCVDMGHRFADASRVSFSELRGEKFIMQQPKTFQYRSIDKHCSDNDFTPDIVLCAAQTKTMKQLVANKMGVAILPEFVTRMDFTFRKIPFDPPYVIQISLCWRPQKVFSQADGNFIRFIKKYIDTPEFHEKIRRG